MIVYLVFVVLCDKCLSLEQEVNVLVNVWKVDLSSFKMFIEFNKLVLIDNLLYGLILVFGNDVVVVVVEVVFGMEDVFVQLMNCEVQCQGLINIYFSNLYGLFSVDIYMIVCDLFILCCNLINDFFDYYKCYYLVKKFIYNNII